MEDGGKNCSSAKKEKGALLCGTDFSCIRAETAESKEKYACKGAYLEKFLQPAILSLLCEQSAHGFYLLSELERRKLISHADATGFYRTLHKLQSDGKLTAEWDMRGGEKPRKVYSITERGLCCLKSWQNTLRGYIGLVENISGAVDSALLQRKK